MLSRMWEFWNSGQHYHLSGGSDTHDVGTNSQAPSAPSSTCKAQ